MERHGGARPVEFRLSLMDAERRGTPRTRRVGARPVEFPLSLTDSERHGHAASARVLCSSPFTARVTPLADACERLRTLCERFANALRTLCGHNATTFGNHPSQLLTREPFCGAFGKMHNNGNRSGSTYITMKQRCLKYLRKTTMFEKHNLHNQA